MKCQKPSRSFINYHLQIECNENSKRQTLINILPMYFHENSDNDDQLMVIFFCSTKSP